ncbi:hypothetical protein C9927_05025 [Pseudidiomarina aestuarii]|uniref:Uncharacterized protein n=1 Tax=Pseudidiomarina aestuarii TaxID=624146 RepID=A0A2T4CNH5_9GAMM|nr:hypothetical protein C9986_01235 [Pseudidiomarina aestuarii]PTB85395.1 hypothetical protein C9988_01350 [Pseudidiomarina aestuarii]PTB87793.1 hypothetical protein C9927_05025 [Pseudidiomarina aestuarii]PTB88719.1 hypothetical protein C9928_05740 [Pseudidiomarina aestuarii]
MALSREFKTTVMELCKEPEFRRALLIEALESYLDGDVTVGNSLLRDYLNGSQSFSSIARDMQVQESSLRRMLSPKGNATAKNLFQLFKACQHREGIATGHEFLTSALTNHDSYDSIRS